MLGTYPHLSAALEAVVVRGAQDNINDDDVGNVDVVLELQCLCVFSLLLYAIDTLCSAIRDLEIFLYSTLRGNMGPYVLVWQCMGSLYEHSFARKVPPIKFQVFSKD